MKDFSSKTFKKKSIQIAFLKFVSHWLMLLTKLHPFVRRSRSLDNDKMQSLRQALITTKNPYELLFNDLPGLPW